MVDYSLLKNEKLRQMVMESESIHTLSEQEIQDMVAKISSLNPEGEKTFMEALENEKREVEEAKKAEESTFTVEDESGAIKEMTPQMAMQQVQQNEQKLNQVMRSFATFVRGTRESSLHEVEEQQAEDLLKLLDTL